MRTLRIFEHISLDGVIQHSDDGDGFPHGEWTVPYRTLAGRDALAALQGERFDLLLGRRTYDLWSGSWPNAPRNPLADAINGATKYVATHRPESLAWGPVEAVGPDVVASVRRIVERDGPDLIAWGSSTLMASLLESGLVRDVVLIVYPVVLGSGKRFAEGTAARSLEHVGTTTTPTGVLLSRYAVAGASKTP